ncbi:hypothetical protein MRY87_07310 [bacterium]|nr:hypothetical protein [bacterium]
MIYVLAGIWIGVPVLFFLLALWSYLEQASVVKRGKKRNEEPRDLFRQALFLTGCSAVTAFIDFLIIQGGHVDFLFGEWVPKPMVRVFLLPAVLYLAAITIGQTRRPKIDKLPRPSEKYRHR